MERLLLCYLVDKQDDYNVVYWQVGQMLLTDLILNNLRLLLGQLVRLVFLRLLLQQPLRLY